MVNYSYKGEKSLSSFAYWNTARNAESLKIYNPEIFNYIVNQFNGITSIPFMHWEYHVRHSYNTLCMFNNLLVNTYDITEDFENKVSFVKDYLQENQDIKESVDWQCRKIYEKLERWYNRLLENPNCLDEVKWEVVRLMKFYENQGIYRKSSINLKRNYQDFCYELL